MFSEKTCLLVSSLGLLQSLAKQWFRNTSYIRKIQALYLKMLIFRKIKKHQEASQGCEQAPL